MMSPLLKHSLLGTTWAATVAAALWYGRSLGPQSAVGGANAGSAAPPPPPVLVAADRAKAAGSETDAAAQRLASGSPEKPKIRLSPEELAEKTKALFATEDPVEKMAGFLALLGELKTNEERTAVLDTLMNGFEPRGRGREFNMLITEWVKQDPVAALEYTKKLGGDGRGRWGSYTALSAWAQRDPDAAIAWAQQNAPKDQKGEDGNWYMVGALNGLAKTDLDRAAQLAQTMDRSQARGEVMDRLLDGFGKRSDDAAQKWVDTLPEGPFREGVTRRLAARLADQDPKSSVAFIDQQPAGKWKTDAYSEVMDRWADRDPNAAGQWLSQYNPGPETDDPRRIFAWKIREKDPESAMAWAGTISDGNRRTKVMVDIARDWFKREPGAARQFVDRQNWPQEVRRRVMN